MLKSTDTSVANPNFRESFARALYSMQHRIKRNALPLGLSALAAVSLAQSGCGSAARNLTNDLNNNLLVEYRDAIWSRRAYNLRYGNCDRPYSTHYRDGFCAGYQDVSNGGDGYVPALPPTEYRGYEYQSAEGAKCVNTWFEGYPAGVAAAKQDKTGEYKDMFISKMINSAVTQDNAKHQLPSDVPIIKSKAGTRSADSSTNNATRVAPPVPEMPQVYQAPPEMRTGSELSLAGPLSTNEQPSINATSVMESVATNLAPVRPALPPIVRGRSQQSQASPQITAVRPSEGSPQPLPMIRQADASVITNQFNR